MKSASRVAHLWLGLAAAVLLGVSCATAPSPLSPASIDASLRTSAWSDLWQDKYTLAESEFRQILAIDPRNQEGLRGMALTRYAKGGDREPAELLIRSMKEDLDSPFLPPVQRMAVALMPDSPKAPKELEDLIGMLGSKGNSAVAKRLGLELSLFLYRYLRPDTVRLADVASQMGVIGGWKLIGPFPAGSGRGFAEDFVGETKSEAWGAGEHRTEDGKTASWVSPDILPPDGYIRPGAYLGDRTWGSTYYAYTEFSLKDETQASFYLKRSGAAALWLDGKLIASDPKERLGAEYRSPGVKLEPGTHKVLVKVASSSRTPGFRLCRTPSGGSGPFDEPYIKHVLSSVGDGVSQDQDLQLARLAALEDAVRAPDADYWLSRQLYDSGRYEAALERITDARKAGAGESALFDEVESLCLGALGRKVEAEAALRRSSRRAVFFAPTEIAVLEDLIEEKRFSEAKTLLHRAGGRTESWRKGALAQVELALESSKDVYGAVQTYAKAYPDSPDLPILLSEKGLGFGYDLKTLAQETRDKGRPFEADSTLIRYYAQLGNHSETAALAAARTAFSPDSASLRYMAEYSSLRAGKLSYDTATQRLIRLTQVFPASPDFLSLLADLVEGRYVDLQKEKALGDGPGKSEADKKFDEAKEQLSSLLSRLLALDPGDYRTRSQLRKIQNLPDLDAREGDASETEAIAEYEAQRRGQASPSADAEIVLDSATYVHFGDGASRVYGLRVVKLLSGEGVRQETSQSLPRLSGLEVTQAYCLKPDGTKMEARVGRSSASYPGLAPGDYLVLRYRGDDSNPGGLSKGIWRAQALQGSYPSFRSIVQIVSPQDAKPAIRIRNGEDLEIRSTETKEEKEMLRTSIEAHNLPALELGRLSPDPRDLGVWVEASNLSDWSSIEAWYRRLFYPRTEPDSPIRAAAEALSAGAKGERETIARLYDFVANEVFYEDVSFMYSAFVPQAASSVLEDRFGDCKDKCALLVALLEARGIEAQVALSQPDYSGAVPPAPSMRFTHVIVLLPSQNLILDPTAEAQTFPRLPSSLVGTWYLPVSRKEAQSSELKRISPTPSPIPSSLLLELKALPDGGITAEGKASLSGIFARSLRVSLLSHSASTKDESARRFFSALLPGFRLKTYRAEGLQTDTEDKDPSISFTGEMASAWPAGESFQLLLPWITDIPPEYASLASGGRAKVEIDYAPLREPVEQSVIFVLPPSWSIVDLPKNSEFSFGPAKAVFTYTLKGGVLHLYRSIELPRTLVLPEEREAFSAFLDAVGAKARQPVLLRRGS